MREFDSPGLRDLHRVIEVSTGPPQIVDLQDEIIQQVIEVSPFIRRRLTPADSVGLFTARVLNSNTGSDTITNDLNPYTTVPASFVGGGYPALVENLDVWLLQATMENRSGPTDFGGGFLGIITDATGMGLSNTGAAIAAINILRYLDSEVVFGNRTALADSSSGLSSWTGAIRISRRADTRIRFETVKTGVGVATYNLDLLFGLFPAGLGQDAVAAVG